ncbi:MAG: DNA-methyltransferase [Bacillota bacterium]|nr:site-specific DNA-methyltransferase [Candidatus Fermentithermobacillaceae bacterium]
MTLSRGYMDTVFCKSCQSMDELPDGSVSLTVTSPPYWNAIDYDRHVEDARQYYRTRSYSVGYRDYKDYLSWLKNIAGEIFRVTKPGGFMALVIGTVLLERKHYPVPFDVVSLLAGDAGNGPDALDAGEFANRRTASNDPMAYNAGYYRQASGPSWEFHQDIIWHKVTGGVKRAGVFLQHPYPGYYYPNIMTEYILVFRKPGPPIYKGRSDTEKQDAKAETDKLFTNEIANTVWHIAPVPPGHIEHPCPYPEEIPYRLIRLYSYPGDLVLDPFCGSGQTLKVARHLGRHFVGYDINRKYVDLAWARLREPLAIRREQLVAVFEKIRFEPPLRYKREENCRRDDQIKDGKAEPGPQAAR